MVVQIIQIINNYSSGMDSLQNHCGWYGSVAKIIFWTKLSSLEKLGHPDDLVIYKNNRTGPSSLHETAHLDDPDHLQKKLLYRSVVFAQYWPLGSIWITCKNNVFYWTLIHAKGGSPDDMDHLKKNNFYLSAIRRPIRMIQMVCKIKSLFAIKMFCNRPFHPDYLDPLQNKDKNKKDKQR